MNHAVLHPRVLADRCHDLSIGFPANDDVRLLLIECRRRIVADAMELAKRDRKIRAVRAALDRDEILET